VFTLTPNGPQAVAKYFVRLTTAAFEAPYAGGFRNGGSLTMWSWDLVEDAPDGRAVTLRVSRGGAAREVTTRIEPETPERPARLGLAVRAGVVVTETLPGTPAASAGLAPGDVIDAVNGTPVLTGKQFRDAVHGWSGGEFVLLVGRGGETYEIARAG
jgi:S1-C subfamily serine protease